jgi:pimeloyl-ACP methyl ester carboxylesterase
MPHLSIAMRVLAAALLLAGMPVEARADETRCIDRLTAEAVAKIGGARLADVRYECVVLSGERAVLIGEAGRPDGEPVLLVHGLGNNAHRDWRNVIPALAPNFRVIVVDLPGFGSSEALAKDLSFDTLAATLDEVLRLRGIERANIVGHSLGGALSLYFAWTHPERTNKLVLVDVAGILQRSVYTRALMQPDVVPATPKDRFIAVLKGPINAFGRHILRRVENTVDVGAMLERNPKALESLVGDRSQVATAISMIEQNFTAAIRETKAPVTLIWGRDDPIAPLRTGHLLAVRLSDARLNVLDGVGHVPMNEATQKFNELLLAGLSASSEARVPAATSTEAQGEVVCKQKSKITYTGRFTSLRLANCAGITIENAEIDYLQIDKSTAELYNVRVTNVPRKKGAAAMLVRESTISGTAISVSGEVGIRTVDSVLDLAGATVQATAQALDLTNGGTIYFSVSDIQSPGLVTDAHDIWTRATVKSKQQ